MTRKLPSPLTRLYCGQDCLPSIEAIIFDKDGTLADSRQFLIQLARLRSHYCAEAITDQIDQSSGDLMESLLAIFGVIGTAIDPDGLMAAGTRQANEAAVIEVLLKLGYPSRAAAKTLVREQFTRADREVVPKAPHTPAFPGTQALFHRLSHSSLKVGILSSDSTANVEEFLRYYDLLAWIHAWQGTEPGDTPKPDPALLVRLCHRLDVSVARTVIVGDSWVDQSLADKAGTAGFISVSQPWGRPPVAGANFVLSNWEDLAVLT